MNREREEMDLGAIQGNSLLGIHKVPEIEALGVHLSQLYSKVARLSSFSGIGVTTQ